MNGWIDGFKQGGGSLGRLRKGLRHLIRGGDGRASQATSISIGKGFSWGHLDSIHLNQTGIIRVVGWTREKMYSAAPAAAFTINGKPRGTLNTFRTYRPDVAKLLKIEDCFHGIVYEFLAFPVDWTGPCTVILEIDGEQAVNVSLPYSPTNPHYSSFFTDTEVRHRENVYAYGPPSPVMSPQVLDCLNQVRGPALDFGCGIGVLVRELRGRGVESFGLELERPAISTGLLPEARDFITLYDGSFPIPYSDGQFECVTCFEVLEHIEKLDAAVSEIARVTRRQFLMSVPDMSAIPDCFPNSVIPWHLLEATHVNFFCQNSLETILHKHFEKVSIARIGVVPVNDTFFFTSLMAVCEA